jgi:hypothetical protein
MHAFSNVLDGSDAVPHFSRVSTHRLTPPPSATTTTNTISDEQPQRQQIYHVLISFLLVSNAQQQLYITSALGSKQFQVSLVVHMHI